MNGASPQYKMPDFEHLEKCQPSEFNDAWLARGAFRPSDLNMELVPEFLICSTCESARGGVWILNGTILICPECGLDGT